MNDECNQINMWRRRIIVINKINDKIEIFKSKQKQIQFKIESLKLLYDSIPKELSHRQDDAISDIIENF